MDIATGSTCLLRRATRGPETSGVILETRDAVGLVAGSGLVFEDAGEHELKGVPDRLHLYRVVSGSI